MKIVKRTLDKVNSHLLRHTRRCFDFQQCPKYITTIMERFNILRWIVSFQGGKIFRNFLFSWKGSLKKGERAVQGKWLVISHEDGWAPKNSIFGEMYKYTIRSTCRVHSDIWTSFFYNKISLFSFGYYSIPLS